MVDSRSAGSTREGVRPPSRAASRMKTCRKSPRSWPSALCLGGRSASSVFMRTAHSRSRTRRDAPIRPAGAISGRSTQRAAEPTASRGIGLGRRCQQHHGAVHTGNIAGLAQVCPGRSGRNGARNNRPSFHARSTREYAQSVSFRPFQHDAQTRGLRPERKLRAYSISNLTKKH